MFTREIASTFESAMKLAGLASSSTARRSSAVRIDRGMWETIVLNLLANALKYTPRGGVTLILRPRAWCSSSFGIPDSVSRSPLCLMSSSASIERARRGRVRSRERG